MADDLVAKPVSGAERTEQDWDADTPEEHGIWRTLFQRQQAVLANRRFAATCFSPGRDPLGYLQEPDIFHDIFGHVPLLMSSVLADGMQADGQGGRQALALGIDGFAGLFAAAQPDFTPADEALAGGGADIDPETILPGDKVLRHGTLGMVKEYGPQRSA